MEEQKVAEMKETAVELGKFIQGGKELDEYIADRENERTKDTPEDDSGLLSEIGDNMKGIKDGIQDGILRGGELHGPSQHDMQVRDDIFGKDGKGKIRPEDGEEERFAGFTDSIGDLFKGGKGLTSVISDREDKRATDPLPDDGSKPLFEQFDDKVGGFKDGIQEGVGNLGSGVMNGAGKFTDGFIEKASEIGDGVKNAVEGKEEGLAQGSSLSEHHVTAEDEETRRRREAEEGPFPEALRPMLQPLWNLYYDLKRPVEEQHDSEAGRRRRAEVERTRYGDSGIRGVPTLDALPSITQVDMFSDKKDEVKRAYWKRYQSVNTQPSRKKGLASD